MSVTIADTRPVEEMALFNPAFLALMARRAAEDHERRSGGRPLPDALLPRDRRSRSMARRAARCRATSPRRWASGSQPP